ncbi:MAG TPA: hypothetical protein PLQ13_13215, partial [Candidatus Krumholzibacteria bacterium]|nr:hypothetical protein [Candidatus Krumholzibacteria bacterium]
MSLACRLPDGRSVAIAPEAADRLSAGVIVLADVRVDDGPSAAEAAEALGRASAARWADTPPASIPGLAEARTLYHSFGMEPTR